MYILQKRLSRDKTRSTGRLSYLLCHPLRYRFLRLPQGDRPVFSTAENWVVAAKNWGSFPLVANVAALRWGCLGGPPHLTCQTVHHCKPGLPRQDMNALFARRSLRQNLYLANTFRVNLYLIEECLQHCQDQFHTPTLLYFSELLN